MNKRIFLLLFGPPGVGKSTFGKLLAKDYNFRHISSGDLLRDLARESSSVGANLADVMSSGSLVDDSFICSVLGTELAKNNSSVLLDGFPRSVAQTNFMLTLSSELDSRLVVLNLTLNTTHLISRLMGRRVCLGCKRSYNTFSINDGEYSMDPLLPSEQDISKCSGCKNLVTREDDTHQVVKNRLDLYFSNQEKISQLLSKEPTINFEVKRGIKDYSLLKSTLDNILNAPDN